MRNSESKPVRWDFISTFSEKHGAAIGESLGPEVIAGHLLAELADLVLVDHFDIQLDSIETIVKQVVTHQPDIIGISIKIGALKQTDELIGELKKIEWEKEPLIVLGGVVATFAATQLLERYPGTILCTGEAEVASKMLVEAVKSNSGFMDIPGITFINLEGRIVSSPHVLWPQSKLHLPARITTERIHKELNGMIWAEDSRGCDYSCTFCSRRTLRGSGFSGDMSPSRVVDDLQKLNQLGIQQVSFTGDDFGGDPERTFLIAEEILRREIKMEWSVSTRADHVFERKNTAEENARLQEIMKKCFDAGLIRVFLGLESGSQSQLRRYGKQVTVEENYKAIEILHDLGVDVVAGYIPIDYLMTVTELHETLEFLEKTGMGLKVSNPLSILRVQAGSSYQKLMKHEGLLGEQTEDLVFYHAKFQDPRVELIAKIADDWVEDIYPLIFGLKGLVASTSLRKEQTNFSIFAQSTLYELRRLELHFLKELVKELEKSKVIDLRAVGSIKDQFAEKRRELLMRTRRKIESEYYGEQGSQRLLLSFREIH